MAETPRFERVRELGSGATARVDLARLVAPLDELEPGTEVAVKTLRPELREDPDAVRALRAEAEAGRRVRHSSLARVLGEGEDEVGPYLVMAYVPGRSLRERLDEGGPLPEPLVRSVGAQLAGALAALHGAGLSHGDLKPENARVDSEGRAVLLDLGFTSEVGADGADGDPGSHAGSLAYLSPERVRGAPAGPAGDVFALGVVLFELATATHPFLAPPTGDGAAAPFAGSSRSSGAILRRSIELAGADQLLASISAARYRPPSRTVPQLSPFLDAVLQLALRRSPGARCSAKELERILREGESGSWWRARLDAAAPGGGTMLRRATHLTPLVGRERELAELAQYLASVTRDGRGAAVLLSGPAGAGKWRLVNDFAAQARLSSNPPLYLYARWTELSESRPTGSLLLLLHRWLQLPPGRAPGEREKILVGSMVDPDTARVLLEALDPDTASSGGASVAAALAAWLGAVSREAPVLVFLDDLHRAGAVTLEALSSLVDRIEETRVLLVLGVRNEISPTNPEALARLSDLFERLEDTGDRPRLRRLDLPPISRDAVRDLVDRLFDRTTPRLRLASVLWRRSRGNPGLIAEILRELTSRGWAVPAKEQADGAEPRLVLTVSPEELPLPGSLDTLIRDRFRALDPPSRHWLERLAVVGGRLEPEFLCTTFPPTTRAEMDDVLGDLVAKGWLVPAANRYRFARPALREAIYRSLGEDRRVRLHAAAARGLEQVARGSAEESFQRAFHLRAARDHGAVLDLVLPLIRTGRGRASPQRMQILARWGLEALDELPKVEDTEHTVLELLEVAVDAADRLGSRGEERELLDRLVELDVDADSHPEDAAHVYLLHGRYAAGTGQFGLARGMLRNAVQLAEKSGVASVETESLRRLATVQAQIGELGEARSLAERALARARTSHHRSLARLALAMVDVLEDHFEDGLDRIAVVLRALRKEPVPPLGVLGYAHLLRARILRSAGRPARAYGSARRAVRLARRAGERRFEVEARARLGVLLLDLDRLEDAEVQLRDALLLSREIEDRRGQTIAQLWIGIVLWEADEAAAEIEIERAVRLAKEIGFYRAEAVGRAVLARILRQHGRPAEADGASQQAHELVQVHGAELIDRITVIGTRALVLDTLGRGSEARTLVRELRRHMRRENQRIDDPAMRRAQRSYSTSLLETVLSPDGPLYPRLTGDA